MNNTDTSKFSFYLQHVLGRKVVLPELLESTVH